MLFQLLTRSWLSMIISITVTTWSRAPSSRLDVVVDSVSNFSWHPRQCSLSSTRTNTKREQTQNENKIKSAMTASRSSCSRCLLPCTFIHSFIHSLFLSGFWFHDRWQKQRQPAVYCAAAPPPRGTAHRISISTSTNLPQPLRSRSPMAVSKRRNRRALSVPPTGSTIDSSVQLDPQGANGKSNRGAMARVERRGCRREPRWIHGVCH